MQPNFWHSILRLYRILVRNTQNERKQRVGKNIANKVALFLARRHGSLFFTYASKEKYFERLQTIGQYKIAIQNNKSVFQNLASQKKNNISTTIASPIQFCIILFVEFDKFEFCNKTLASIKEQDHSDYNLIIICPDSISKKVIDLVSQVGLSDYKIFNKESRNIPDFKKIISDNSRCDYFILLDCSITLYPDSLYQLNCTIREDSTEADIIYCDEDVMEKNNCRNKPFFKPDWSPHLLLSYNYIGNFLVCSAKLPALRDVDDKFQFDHNFILRLTYKASSIIHIPRVLVGRYANFAFYYTTVSEIDTESTNTSIETERNNFITKPRLEGTPLVSIIIPTKGKIGKLKPCIQSIKNKSTYGNYEIILLDNSKKSQVRQFFGNDCKIIEFDETFNYSRINNLGVEHANGEYLLFLNDDTKIASKDWLESMLAYATQKDVGAVGPLLLFSSSHFYPTCIQQAGILLGVAGPAVNAFAYCHAEKHHYFGFDKVIRNVTAVTGACMMVRKEVFDKAGRFDEKFIVAFGDTDLCMRIGELGYHIVYNPSVKLFHDEGSSRGFSYPANDEILFYNKWERQIISGDRFYNPNLSHLVRDFRIAPVLCDTPALSVLLEVYFFREDLHKQFQITNTSYDSLMDWAAVEGVTSDTSRVFLLPYNKYYVDNCSSKVRVLAEKIYQFNHDHNTQIKHPEVFSGNYDRLLVGTQ